MQISYTKYHFTVEKLVQNFVRDAKRILKKYYKVTEWDEEKYEEDDDYFSEDELKYYDTLDFYQSIKSSSNDRSSLFPPFFTYQNANFSVVSSYHRSSTCTWVLRWRSVFSSGVLHA